MATILNNDPGASRDGSAGWVVAVVVLVLVVLFGLFVLPNLMNSEAGMDGDAAAGTDTGVRGDLGADQGGTGSSGFNTTITTSTTTVTTDSDASASSTPR